ncbi:unnamed protein product [Bemisia tabaci]|uniref:Uncharacterized protein n=1 Tax=Bemisia tabaci TaxID=7038 RepID=A0A9P0A4K4_BEMTA|nr:unnamed protein product [Bemisia tabaci]
MNYIVLFTVVFCVLKNSASSRESLFHRVQAVIFDMDGLLFDTESIYFSVHSEIIARFNKTYTKSMQWDISGTNFSTKSLVDSFGLNITPEGYLEEYEKLCIDKLSTMEFMPGAEKLVKHLYSHKVPIAIATGNNEKFFDVIPTHYKNF